MKKLCFLFLSFVCVFSSVFTQDKSVPEAKKPAVLILSWNGREGQVDMNYLQRLARQGFVIDYTDSREELTWDKIKEYNVLVLYDFPTEDKVVQSPQGGPCRGPALEETMKLLKRFLADDGGILINIQQIRTPKFYTAAQKALSEWGAKLPVEFIVDPAAVMTEHPRLNKSYSYTDNILPSPVSQDVKGIWYPSSIQHGGYPYFVMSGPIEVDKSWTTVVKASKGSITKPIVYEKIPDGHRIKNAFQRKDGVTEPPLFAIKQLDNGARLALFRCNPIFHFGSGTSWIHDGAMLDKGLDNKPSDFGKLLENTLVWLGEPSLKTGKVGGAVQDSEHIKPVQQRKDAKTNVDRGIRNHCDLALAVKRQRYTKTYKGFIGAQTELSGGKGGVRQYANVGKELGLNFIIFMEDFRNLSKEGLQKLIDECRKYRDKELLLIPGYRMETNIGNKIFFFGLDPIYPYDLVLTGPDKRTFKLQGKDKDGKWVGSNKSLHFVFDHVKKEGKRAKINSVGYYGFKDAQKKGGMGIYQLRAYSMAGVKLYRDGILIEDVTDQYLKTNQSTMTGVPVAIDLVKSPTQMKEDVRKGVAITTASARSMDYLWEDGLSWNHQYKGMNTGPTTGPVIQRWGSCVRMRTFGAESAVPENSLMTPVLEVTSDVGIKQISMYDGEKLFRRFFPDGAKNFVIKLFLNGCLQKNISVIVEDMNGGKALSFPVRCWKDGSPAPVFCGDHVNDGDMRLFHGPGWQKPYYVPQIPDYGATWDGGPKPVLPLLPLGHVFPSIMTKDKQQQRGEFLYQTALLRFCDERVGRTSSVADLSLTPMPWATPWTGYGPITPVPYFKGESTLTYFDQEMYDVHPTMWGAIGMGKGPTGNLYEQKITFVRDCVLSRFDFSGLWRTKTSGTHVLLLTGKNDKLLTARDVSPRLGSPRDAARYTIPKGGWFAGVSRQPSNAQLYFNRGETLQLMVRPDRTELDAVIPQGGLSVKRGYVFDSEIFTMIWPMDMLISDSRALMKIIDYLRNPQGLELLKGKRKPYLGGLTELIPDNYVTELKLPWPKDKLKVMLPVRVSGMNNRWTAMLWQKIGYRGKQFYGNGSNRFRELGIDEKGRIYFPISPYLSSVNHFEAGHPVIADENGNDLFIQVTCLKDRTRKEKPLWHVSVNNPTDKELTTTIRKNMDLPGLDLADQQLTLKPGEYRVLLHQEDTKKTAKK